MPVSAAFTIAAERAKGHHLARYLANGEARFANYAVPGPFTAHIIFNHSYASDYEDIAARAARLREAVETGDPDLLGKLLRDERIDLLMLAPLPDAAPEADYMVDYVYNEPPRMSLPKEIHFPQRLLAKMVQAGILVEDVVGRYRLFRVVSLPEQG